MSVALLSQSKKSEGGIAHPSSCFACDNVLDERTANRTAKSSIPERTYWSPVLGTGQTHTHTHKQTAVDMEVPPELKNTVFSLFSFLNLLARDLQEQSKQIDIR